MSAQGRYCAKCRRTISPRGGLTPEFCAICGNPLAQRATPVQVTQPALGYATQTPVRSGKAIAALILGILSFTGCFVVAGVVAVVIGTLAQKEIDASAGQITGRGMATAGVAMGGIVIAVTVLMIVLAPFAAVV